MRSQRLVQSIRLLSFLLCLAAGLSAQAAPDAGDAQRLFALVNQERAKAGVAPLTFDERLSGAARKHSQLMAQNDSLQHQFDGEPLLTVRLSNENVRSSRDGENVALDSDLARAHAMLMQSPPHRANILNPRFNAVGIGLARDGDLIFITEDFAFVLPSYSEIEADAVVQQAIGDYARSQRLPIPARKVRAQLATLACGMALDDNLDSDKTRDIPGISGAVVWTAYDLRQLPPALKKLLDQPLAAGYSLGVCYAPSVSHPGGVYWLVTVVY